MGPGLAIGGITTVIVVLSLCCTGIITIAAIALPFYFINKMRQDNQKKAEALMATGKQGEATILALQDTGMRINDDPRVAIVMEVRIPDYPPYQVQKTITLPLIRMSQVQVGAVVAVMADPTQPNNPDKVGLLLR
jgi:hypothetical protein